jgi:predicted amidohydrolase
MTTLRVAAFQRIPLIDDVPGTTERLLEDLAWCDRHDVALALFPECYLQGDAADRETICARALTADGAEFAQVLGRLAAFRVAFVVGFIERRGATFLNSAAVVRAGRLLGVYAKRHPNESGFEAGREQPVFVAGGWTFGVNICNDANFPEAALGISRQGAQLLCYPLNNMLPPDIAVRWRSRSVRNLCRRALDTGCWILSADVVGNLHDRTSYGCTCIVRRDGCVIARAGEGSEAVVTFDVG